MRKINWKEAADWSNQRPNSLTIVWDRYAQKTEKFHWRKFAKHIRKPSTAFSTGYVKRKVNGRDEVVASIVDPEVGYFMDPSVDLQYLISQESFDRFDKKGLFEHLRSKGHVVEVWIL